MTRPTWKPTTPKPTDSEAQAYVNGWQHYLDGNDVRFGNPYRVRGHSNLTSYAWTAGALDCMEAPSNDEPDPHAAGFPGDPAV